MKPLNLGNIVHNLVTDISQEEWNIRNGNVCSGRRLIFAAQHPAESDLEFVASAPTLVARLVWEIVKRELYEGHWEILGPFDPLAEKTGIGLDSEDYEEMLSVTLNKLGINHADYAELVRRLEATNETA